MNTPSPALENSMEHPHLIDGEFQSDKYPTCPRGKVPLSVKDKTAQDLLWQYAQRRRAVDAEFAADLEIALKNVGYTPSLPSGVDVGEIRKRHERDAGRYAEIIGLNSEYEEAVEPWGTRAHQDRGLLLAALTASEAERERLKSRVQELEGRPTEDAYMRACRALHWHTAQLRANGIEPATIAEGAPHYPPDDAFPMTPEKRHDGGTDDGR